MSATEGAVGALGGAAAYAVPAIRKFGVGALNFMGLGDTSVKSPTAEFDQKNIEEARAQAAGSRQDQSSLQALLEARARGEGPSVAQSQLQQATQANIAQQASMAASARGGAAAQSAAQRQAMMGGAQAQQQAVGQASLARAQEMASNTGLASQGIGQMRGQDLQAQQGESQLGLGIGQLNMEGRKAAIAGESENKKAKAGIISGMMSAAGGLISDERLKTDIKDARHGIDCFLNSLSAKQYQYKPQAGEEPGTHFGVVAQDAERSQVGRDVVHETSEGKAFHGPQTLAALLASVARLNERLGKVEGR